MFSAFIKNVHLAYRGLLKMSYNKSVCNLKILEDLQKIASIVPTPIYWEDVNSVILGVNEHIAKAIGLKTQEECIGKTLYDLYPKEMADHIKKHNEEVIRRGEVLSQEEMIKDITTGQIKYFAAVKAPLRDDEGNIIGIVGTSVEITAQKDAERLRLENEMHKKLAQEQEKFIKIANQVAHDIRSPLASLLMIIKSCTEIPESDRIALREASIGIGDIANHLLSQYQKKENDPTSGIEDRQPILVSAMLLQLLTDKKYQYQDLSIKFDHHFIQEGHFAFIKIEPSSFKRMISNIVNNAVDAFDDNEGKVNVKLDVNNEWVKVIIEDNGKGMPPELVNKIIGNIAVTAGKKTGHGIGLTQVRETLQRNQGEIAIDSELGKGTTIILTFPRIRAPHWIAEEIKLGKADTVIILDDDNSIHGAWRTHFDPILKKAPNIKLKHFVTGKEALEFIAALPPADKKKVFLLTDYELLKQELNGLHVVAKSQIQRSILVTSHYANQLVREQAAKTGTKILPKQLASEIPIKIDETIQYENERDLLKNVDAIIVDDDEKFVRNLVIFVFGGKIVDQYHDPYHFLKNVAKYPKDSKIYLDNNFAVKDLSGIELARQLHEQGYTRLYLLSGENFQSDEIPHYLTVIKKDDIDSIKNS
jgi:PAS domain S-box-containing protein